MPRRSTPPDEAVLPPIHTIRGRRVMLDSDLAALYETTPMAFNQAIKRNAHRFPTDFAFQLSREELVNLKSQSVISSSRGKRAPFSGHGGARRLPWVFTEHGAIMAAMVLRSERAVAMSVYVVRAFVRLREEALSHTVILKHLSRIDKKLLEHISWPAGRRRCALPKRLFPQPAALDDAPQRADRNRLGAMHGHDDLPAVGMTPLLMASLLTGEHEPVPTQNANHLVRAAHRMPLTHGSMISRTFAPAFNARASGSNHRARASRALCTASSSVSPAVAHPGSSGK